MHNMKNVKQRLVVLLLLCVLVLALAGCKNFFHPDGPNAPEIPTEKTFVQFNNLEVFPVTVYSDTSRLNKIADVGVGKTATVEAAPSPSGTSFYPRYHLNVENIPIPPYDGEVIIARIDEKRTNQVAIPPLEAIEAGDAFIKLENASTAYSLTMKKGSVEMFPIGSGSTIVMQNETAGYSIPPGAISGYSLLRNPSTAVAFPSGLTEFRAGYIYLLRYDGAALTLTEAEKPVFQLRHTVRYDANGGSGSVPPQQAVIQGSGVAAAGQGSLSKVGHTFNGWNTNANGSGTVYAAGSSIMPTANITLYAQWSAITYTINYHANGASGTTPSPQSATYGESRTISNEGGLSLAGWLFGGWNTKADGTGIVYAAGSSLTVDSNLTLYAQWMTDTTPYTVSYHANGGDGTAPSSQTATFGTSIAVSGQGSLNHAGRAFNGWNTRDDGTGTAYFTGSSLTVHTNITLYAQWIIQYMVSYDANGGSGTLPASQKVNTGSDVTVAGQGSLSRTGCTFNGWNSNSGGTGMAYAAGSSLTVSGDVTLYAQWTVKVTYNVNGGSGTAPGAQTVTAGSSVTLAGQGALARIGYVFGGWNTSSSGLGTTYAVDASLTVNENVTLYAKWIMQCTVTYNLNGGSGTRPSAQTINQGSNLTIAGQGNLSRTGYTFGGWNTNAAGTGIPYAVGASLTVNENVTLYAVWMVTVIYNANGGSGTVPGSQTVNPGSSITLAGQGSLSRSGCTFSGWNTNAAGTGTSYAVGASLTANTNITLYAKWTVTVSYDANGGSGTVSVSQTATAGSSVTVAGQGSLVYSGKIFDGWNTNSDGTGTTYAAGSSLTVNANTTLYAQWVMQYTVSYDANGGSGDVPGSQTVNPGASVTVAEQGSLAYSGKIFDGWNTNSDGTGTTYAAGSSLTVNANTTLYAQWATMPTLSLADSLTWISTNAVEGGVYTITLQNNESITSKTLSYGGKNVTIILTGGMSMKTISASTVGSYFTVREGVTLTLDNNVALLGLRVHLYAGSALIMNNGSKIMGNTSANFLAGAVDVGSGTFTMAGGEISGNLGTNGGGVSVGSGTFTMSGGEISGNSTNSGGDPNIYGYGGGVFISSSGTFIKTGGTIYGSNASTIQKNTSASGGSHAVHVAGGNLLLINGPGIKKRITTADTGVNLDSRIAGAAGGWE
ncbi:hypothetical protein AGMMS49928_14790 [Spirochaetia bacterium]|nr:hypothetical protein AGMMS49928_14790 [Spirochaetia bacterium]